MSTRSMRADYERERDDFEPPPDKSTRVWFETIIPPGATITGVTICASPWPDKESDRAARCQICGQLLGKRCRRDGCGKQAKP